MIIATLLATSLLVQAPADTVPDPFVAEDKMKHFVTSFVVGSLAGTGARVAGLDRDESVVIGTSFTVTAGVVKELKDRQRGGFFSIRDLFWDIAGAGLALLLLTSVR